MSANLKREINNALIRIVPLLLGIAVGKGWLSGEDASAIEQVAIIILGVAATYWGSTSRPSVRAKLAKDVLDGRQ